MFRRLAVAWVACLAVLAFPFPASAADSFTAPTTVVAPPCATPGAADAAFGGGTIRGFASFDACSHAIYYFQGGSQGYTRVLSPYRGNVLAAAADQTATYLVYVMTDAAGNPSGLGVAKRTHAGSFAGTRVLSTVAGRQIVATAADIAATGGKWWAVWTEQVGPTEFAPQQLFQAKTFGTPADHQQITFTGPDIDNAEPSISLDGNGAVLAWRRQTAPEMPGPSDLWVATNANTAWSSRVFSNAGTQNGSPDIKRIAGSTYVAFVRDGQVVESENTTGAWTSHVFLTPGSGPRVGATFGSVFVVWNATNGRVFYARGNVGSQSFVGQYVSAPGTRLDSLVAANGKGTLPIRSGLRLYSITSLT